jgi:multicomponent K+:H+ antiporter subunit E
MLARWFPHPWLSTLLGAAWLALSNSIEPVHLLSALGLAWLIPKLIGDLLLPANRVNWPAAILLMMVVLKDIVISNITVARLVLGRQDRIRPAWFEVPLVSSHPMVNALLASIITTTPGTVSATLDEDRQVILVHALDCADPAEMIRDIDERYQQPLLTIFRVGQHSKSGAV